MTNARETLFADVRCAPRPHEFVYRERDGQTWNVCCNCGFAELWANGLLIKTTDEAESARLDAMAEAERAG